MRSDRRQAFEEAEAEGSGLGDGAWPAPAVRLIGERPSHPESCRNGARLNPPGWWAAGRG
jgi:hypothetical protein